MKKILFISTRNPYSNRYSGDVIGSKKIVNTLKKISNLDILTIDDNQNLSSNNFYIFKKPSFFSKIIHIVKSLIFLKPLQFGFFYSNEMQKFINDNASNYDLIFFYHIRASQYLPNNFYGKTIIEIGDLYSSNYMQTFDNLNVLNPLKYIYLLESFLVKRIENEILRKFDKIIFFSKQEIKKIDKQFLNKVIHMNISIENIKKKYRYSKNNKKILFIGNLKYLPNILAVKNFIKLILPKLKKKIPDIRLEIIGEVSNFDKFLLSKNKNVKFWGAQKNLDKFINGSICGLANLKIATGVQGKILSYMSYGLPVVCSKKVAHNFDKHVLSYSEENEMINKIFKLKNSKKLSDQISKKSLRFINSFRWKKN